jgi:hypothetical protein
VEAGSVADISEVHAASVFMVGVRVHVYRSLGLINVTRGWVESSALYGVERENLIVRGSVCT